MYHLDAARLRALRVERGLTQAAVARHMRVSSMAVSHWEHGTKRPRGDRLERLLELYDAHPMDVFVEVHS